VLAAHEAVGVDPDVDPPPVRAEELDLLPVPA
jgi:hypothetical protein